MSTFSPPAVVPNARFVMVADPPAYEVDAETPPTPPIISITAPSRTAVRPREILCIVPRLSQRRHALRVAGQHAMRATTGRGSRDTPRRGEERFAAGPTGK